MAGRTTGDDVFGIVIVDTDDEDQARAIMNADPAVAHELMHAELYPYRIAVIGAGVDSTLKGGV